MYHYNPILQKFCSFQGIQDEHNDKQNGDDGKISGLPSFFLHHGRRQLPRQQTGETERDEVVGGHEDEIEGAEVGVSRLYNVVEV